MLRIKSGFFAFLLATVVHSAFAGAWNTNEQGVVLNGHDVVAYHLMDQAVAGNAAHAATYDGAKFLFANADNLANFNANPSKYAPKFNGYCAFAAAKHNAKVPANADTFKIYNGELLVFFNDLHEGQKVNTKLPWNSDEKALYGMAIDNWKTLSEK